MIDNPNSRLSGYLYKIPDRETPTHDDFVYALDRIGSFIEGTNNPASKCYLEFIRVIRKFFSDAKNKRNDNENKNPKPHTDEGSHGNA